MEFKKYTKIENTYQQKNLEKIQDQFGDIFCIVQEKIHGMNFAIYYNGSELKCASRNQFLDTNIKNHQEVVAKFETEIKKLYKTLQTLNSNTVEEITIIGELFGGDYKHPDVPRKNVSRIQKGVYYSNDVEFLAFDLKVNGNMVSPFNSLGLFEQHDIPYIPILAIKPLSECLEYPNDFESEIYKIYNLPKIENNICEGIVIKPVDVVRFGNGQQIMLKNKNDNFAEVTKVKKTPRKPDSPLSELAHKMLEELQSLATENRFDNVVSKLSKELEMKDFGMMMGLFSKDCMEEFSGDLKLLEKPEEKKIKGRFQNIVVGIVKKKMKELC